MNAWTLKPSSLQGSLTLPSSKSHTLRAILFGLMGKGRSRIARYLPSPDTLSMIQAARLLGAQVTVTDQEILIDGVGGNLKTPDDVINAGNSGQVLRFIGALAGLLPDYTILTGDHSICSNRPAQPLLDGLNQLGAFARSSRGNGFAPLIIRGPIQPGSLRIDGADSQPVSALLIASSFLEGTTKIQVDNPGETPWIALTLDWMRRMGRQVESINSTPKVAHYTVTGTPIHSGFDITIPGDLSSAAFPIAAALITRSELTLHNVDLDDCQGDKQVIQWLKQMGACIEVDPKHRKLTLHKHKGLHGITIDVNPCIDALPILAVIGCFAQGKTHLCNAGIARKKESDRLHAITTELRKMGADIEELPDALIISHSPLTGADLFSHADHRIALALSIAALGATLESRLTGIDCISKSYPTFLHDFRTLGAVIQ